MTTRNNLIKFNRVMNPLVAVWCFGWAVVALEDGRLGVALIDAILGGMNAVVATVNWFYVRTDEENA